MKWLFLLLERSRKLHIVQGCICTISFKTSQLFNIILIPYFVSYQYISYEELSSVGDKKMQGIYALMGEMSPVPGILRHINLPLPECKNCFFLLLFTSKRN